MRALNHLGYLLTGIAAAAFAVPAQASEGGGSFYLLGSGGPGAADLPPVTGVFFDNTYLHYDGSAEGGKDFVIGGNVVAGLHEQVDGDFATVLWVPSTNFAGATLAFEGTFVFGNVDAGVNATLTGPHGGQVTVSKEDNAFMVGDPVATAELSWGLGGNTHLAVLASTSVPVGTYREDQLANLSFHRWITDLSTALTWHDSKAVWDVSGKIGLTFNGTNDYTDYDTGTELHLEGAVEHRFSKSFTAGVLGYHFQQVSGDSGTGATLGPFKGRVSAVGMTAAYNFVSGHTPVTIRGKLFKEFDAKNRVGHGTSVLFSLDFPLKMNLPPAAPAAP